MTQSIATQTKTILQNHFRWSGSSYDAAMRLIASRSMSQSPHLPRCRCGMGSLLRHEAISRSTTLFLPCSWRVKTPPLPWRGTGEDGYSKASTPYLPFSHIYIISQFSIHSRGSTVAILNLGEDWIVKQLAGYILH